MDSSALRQAFFLEPAPGAATVTSAAALLKVLLAQDGSTTRVCEAIAGGAVSLQLAHQCVTTAVPAAVRQSLPGTQFIERVSSLCAHGQVMMDNLVYVALEGLSAPLRAGLEGGSMPIGHLLELLWVRRRPLPAPVTTPLLARLWQEVGDPDAAASRAYTIATPQGPLFLIAETYRYGMRWLPAPAPVPGTAARSVPVQGPP